VSSTSLAARHGASRIGGIWLCPTVLRGERKLANHSLRDGRAPAAECERKKKKAGTVRGTVPAVSQAETHYDAAGSACAPGTGVAQGHRVRTHSGTHTRGVRTQIRKHRTPVSGASASRAGGGFRRHSPSPTLYCRPVERPAVRDRKSGATRSHHRLWWVILFFFCSHDLGPAVKLHLHPSEQQGPVLPHTSASVAHVHRLHGKWRSAALKPRL
jgi:hypothetical protein